MIAETLLRNSHLKLDESFAADRHEMKLHTSGAHANDVSMNYLYELSIFFS